MRINDLHPNPGEKRKRKRVGRGIAAGQGKTAGRGTKGMGARRGGGKNPYFEGGQLPLVRRLPFKRGFTNIFRIEYQEVNVDQLEEAFKKKGDVSPATLAEIGLIHDAEKPVKVLGRGEIKKALSVQAHGFTQGAKDKIEAAGGSVDLIALELTGALATVKKLRKDQIAARREKQIPHSVTRSTGKRGAVEG